ncbi:hypothetical protein [Pyxidicoccus trucidator]|uniref:hypothetical protein n=1 Tax=Pyxidicoccus trucidator TaxID=2709662 RepID=UPI0013DB2F8D|nr:hypothetical protein [Pyxidicoccus trucidator]
MHPSARFLRELTLGIPNYESDSSYGGAIQAIVEAGGSRSLRSLFIGDFKYPGETEISWTPVGNVEPLYAVLPRLGTLRLRGGGVVLGKIRLPELREFVMETGGLPLAAVKSIARAQWPSLERLEVWFGNRHYGAKGGVSDIRPILDGRGRGAGGRAVPGRPAPLPTTVHGSRRGRRRVPLRLGGGVARRRLKRATGGSAFSAPLEPRFTGGAAEMRAVVSGRVCLDHHDLQVAN